jgi:hypothetical protein
LSNTVTIVGVVYSPNQNRVRRVVVSDEHDLHILIHRNMMTHGEQFMVIPKETFDSFTHPNHLHDHVAAVLGSPATSHTCAVVAADDTIVAAVHADPAIDDHPDGHIIQDDDAVAGLKYDLVNAKVIKE